MYVYVYIYINTYIYIYIYIYIHTHTHTYMGFPDSSDGKESACNAGDPGLIPVLGRSHGEANGNPLLPGEFHEQRSLAGYSLWGCKELHTTEQLTHT